MTVSNGQLANQNTFNTSFMSREVDTDTVGKVDLLNPEVASGASVINSQRFINAVASALGMTTAEVYNFLFTYSSNIVGAANDTVLARLNALTLKYRGTTGLGHAHSGVDGDSEKISAANLLNINQYFAEWQVATKTGVTGSSTVITTEMSGKTPGGTSSQLGVITSAPSNRAILYNSVNGEAFEDAEGQKVYGRVTESAGVWTLSFYTNEAGVETAYSFGSSSDVQFFFLEVFSLATRPTIPSTPEFGSLDTTADVVDATTLLRGLVNTLTQSFAGFKTFTDGVKISELLHLNQNTDSTTTGANQTVNVTETFWVLTNASLTSVAGFTNNSASRLLTVVNKTGATITLRHESGSAAAADRVLSPTLADLDWRNNQALLFVYDVTVQRWYAVGETGNIFSLAAVGSSPNANGASYNSATGAFNLQPADATNPGVMTTADQSFAGVKSFQQGIVVSNILAYGQTDKTDSGTAITLSALVNPITKLSNASLVSLAGIPSDTRNRFIVLLNITGNTITLLNESGSASASNRILTGTGLDLQVSNNASVWLMYNVTSSRWYVVGGSGGGGSSTRTPLTKTANYTILDGDFMILANPTSGDITLTLPSAASVPGKTFTVKRTHGTANFLRVSSSDNIDGAANNYIDNQYDFVNYYSDGTTYWTM